MNDAALPATVPSLLLPLADGQLLVPNVSVAEVVGYRRARRVKDMPEWFVGQLRWRQMNVPLVAFEIVTGQLDVLPPASAEARVAIMNSVLGAGGISFYGILAQGLPRLVRVAGEELSLLDQPEVEGVAANVRVDGEPAVIPDLDAIERKLVTVWPAA